MRLPQDKLGKIKNYVHGAQGVVIAIAWVMCIVIFTRQGQSDGRVGWYFGLVSSQLSRGKHGTDRHPPSSAGYLYQS